MLCAVTDRGRQAKQGSVVEVRPRVRERAIDFLCMAESLSGIDVYGQVAFTKTP